MSARKFLSAVAMAVLVPVLATAQPGAKWLTPEARELNFPASQYVSGFATASPYGGEAAAATQKRAGTQAATLAASGIRTLIQNQSELASSEAEVDGNFQFVSQFNEYTRQSSNAEIAGQKLKAKKQCTGALEPLARAEYAQDLLTAVSPANRGGLQQQRCSQLKRDLFQQLIDLEQSIYIFVECKEDNFGAPSTLLANQIKSLLASNQCSFCSDPAQADYRLTITATTRKHDVDNPNFKFSYADVQVDLYSAYKRMSVYSDELHLQVGQYLGE